MSAPAAVRAGAEVLVEALRVQLPGGTGPAQWFRDAVREALDDIPRNDQGQVHAAAFKALVDAAVSRRIIDDQVEEWDPQNGGLSRHVLGLLATVEKYDTFVGEMLKQSEKQEQQQAEIDRLTRAEAGARLALKLREFSDVVEVEDFDIDEADIPVHPGGGIHAEAFEALWAARLWARREETLRGAGGGVNDD